MYQVLIKGQSHEAHENLCSPAEDDGRLKSCELIQSQSTFGRMFAEACFLFGLDVSSIYKSRSRHIKGASYCAFLASELQHISLNQFDKRRARLKVVYQTFFLYLALKLATMTIIGIIDLILLPQNQEQKISRSNGTIYYNNNNFPFSSVLRKMMPSYYQAALEFELKSPVSHFISICSLFNDLIMLQFTASVEIFYGSIIMPIIWRNNLLDAANLRFLLNPLTEIQRLDVITERHLGRLLIEAPKNRLIQDQLNCLPNFRLYNFSSIWHSRLYRYVYIVCFFSVNGALICQPIFYYTFFHRVKKNFCEIGQIENCTFSLLFAKQDCFYISEFVLGVCILGFLHAFLFELIISNSICQLSFVGSAKEDLDHCLMIVRYSNSRYDHMRQKSIQFVKNLEPISGFRYLMQNDLTIEQQHIELILLRTYIKLMLTKDEIQRNAYFIGRVSESLFFLSSMPGVLALLMKMLSNSDNDTVTLVLLAISWILLNPSLIACAFVYSRTIKLEKIAWSILAELSFHQDMNPSRLDSQSFSSESHIKLIADRWRKLVESFTLSDLRNSIDPFGMRLTYGRVMSINYFGLSFALILRSF